MPPSDAKKRAQERQRRGGGKTHHNAQPDAPQEPACASGKPREEPADQRIVEDRHRIHDGRACMLRPTRQPAKGALSLAARTGRLTPGYWEADDGDAME